MASEHDIPGLEQQAKFLTAAVKGIPLPNLGALQRFVMSLHVACCLCEPICLDALCDCGDDAHLDPECHFLRDRLMKVITAAGSHRIKEG